jgi:hypothetical protein
MIFFETGQNIYFSRETFDPPLDLSTIDTMLFNVIPQRDIVPMVRGGILRSVLFVIIYFASNRAHAVDNGRTRSYVDRPARFIDTRYSLPSQS